MSLSRVALLNWATVHLKAWRVAPLDLHLHTRLTPLPDDSELDLGNTPLPRSWYKVCQNDPSTSSDSTPWTPLLSTSCCPRYESQ